METVFFKLKNILIDNANILLFIFFLGMILSGLWMYEEYTRASYEEKNVTSYTQLGSYTYSAPVTKSNPLYPKGTRLEMGNPAYFFSVSPTADISFLYSIVAADSADLNVKAKTMIVAKCGEGSGEEQEIFWQKNFQVSDSITAKMKNGDSLTSHFTIDVPDIQLMVKEVQDQLNYSSSPTTEIVTIIQYEGKINEESVKGVKNFAIPVNISSTYYQMPENLSFSEDKYKSVMIKKSPSLSTIKFPLFLFLLSAVFEGVLIPFRKMNKVDPAYIEKLEKESKNSSFKEFISKGELPEDRKSFLQIKISSLKDLVDAAVDMNERVIHDAKSGGYFVIHNGILYIFFDTSSE